MAACKVVPAGGRMINGVLAGTAAVQSDLFSCEPGWEQEQNNRLPAIIRKGSVLKEYILCIKL